MYIKFKIMGEASFNMLLHLAVRVANLCVGSAVHFFLGHFLQRSWDDHNN